jgi:hypothetical protein
VIGLVFASEWTAIIGVAIGLPAILVSAWQLRKYLLCQQPGCRAIGVHPHGHLRFCGVHHPLTPADGKITPEHIAETTLRLVEPPAPALPHRARRPKLAGKLEGG